MKILVLGKNGQLGKCLYESLKNCEYESIFFSREDVDVNNFLDAKSKILKIQPDIIINATAYTQVDKAEEEKELSNLTNNVAVRNIADISNIIGCVLFHISTDYVFDGNKKSSYKENSTTNPQCEYGTSKLKGEVAVQQSGCKYFIIRTSWLFSAYGNNFLKTMIRLANEGDEIKIVGDQVGRPTYAPDLSNAICRMLPMISSENINSTYHYSGDKECSWVDFASIIFDIAHKINLINTKPSVKVIKTAEYLTQAKRPLHSSLDSSLIKEVFGISPSNWNLGIKSVVESLVWD